MTTKELVHIAKNIGATEITDNDTANAVEKAITICSTHGIYGVSATLFKATDNNYYYIGKPFSFIQKFIV